MDRRGRTYRLILLIAAMSGGQVAGASPAEDEFAVAAGHYQARRWDLAVEAFADFTQQFPSHALVADAQFYQAEALAQLGDFAKSSELLDELIRTSRTGSKLKRAMFRRGEAAYLARDVRAARDHLQAFQEAYPGDELLGYLLVYLGDVHADLGNLAEAEAAYRACLEKFPQGPLTTSCKNGLARVLLAREALDDAQPLLAELATTDEPSIATQASIKLAHVASMRRDFAAVKRHCEEIVAGGHALEPAVQLLYAEALYELGDGAAAEEQFADLSRSPVDDAVRRRALYGLLRHAADRGDQAVLERLASEFLAASGDDPLTANVHAALGESRLSQQRYDEAAKAFAAAVQKSGPPKIVAQCHAGLAICLAARGEIEAARRHLQFLESELGSKSDNAATFYRVAELAYSAGARGEAAELFQRAAETSSSSELAAKALAGLAWAQLRQEDLFGAAEAFEELLKKYPSDPRAADAALLRARILERRADYDAALAAYRRVIDNFSEHEVAPEALYLAARLHDRLQQMTEARGLYDRLTEEHPDASRAAEAMYHLGWLLRESGDEETALARWRNVHERGHDSPHWHEATYLLAEDSVQRGDLAEARGLVAALLDSAGSGGVASDEVAGSPEQSPEHAVHRGSPPEIHARSLLLAGQLAMHDEAWERAQDYFARIVVECPDDPLCLPAEYWVAEIDYRMERFDEAVRQFEKLQGAALGRDEAWVPFVPLRRAQILAHQKQWADAMPAARMVLEQHHDFPLAYEAYYVLGRCHAARAEFQAAREAYQKVLESDAGGKTETAAMAQWMIAESYMHQRDYDAALRSYLRGEILYPYPQWQARSLLQAGKCYELLEEWSKAESIYRRLIASFPDSDVASDVRDRLELVTRQIADRRK